jgi:predicted CoA-substrate-specific enzyme activase
VLAVDLGKVTTSLALGELRDDGLHVIRTHAERHLGEPLRPLIELYMALDHERLAALAATGVYGDRLGAPALGGLPEEIAQEQAAAWLYPDGPLNVVRVGGGGYSVLTRDAAGHVRYEANERCSAGTGETVEGLCSRLGRGLDEAVELALVSPDAVTVTSRCAVFAKSELTHFANQGESHGRIFRGLFAGVARNVHSLYDKSKVDGPVVLIGHGALIRPIADGVAALSDAPVSVAAEAGVFEALGALRYAAAHLAAPAPAFPADAAALVRPHRRRIQRLRPAKDGPGSVVRLEEPRSAATGPGAPAVLGLDLGSTGAKAALLDLASGAVLASVYRRTAGNPVEAAQALVAQIREMALSPVVAVGLTGSGRDAAAAVFRAAYPHAGQRLVVQNEIVAHATAATRLDPDGGRSLSIVEIGGQDAKFINVEAGRVVDADMNRVCSAGTGSFLEEQAVAHGVDDIAEFGRLAARSEGPPDLGQTCTVFVADVAAEALGDGFSRDDIFAGLQHSVVRNFRSRVMGQRRLQDRIFFQGKPATDPALARTLAAVLERDVYVPPDPGAMGAVGIALLAGEALTAGLPAAGSPAAEPLDLSRALEARVGSRREFQCKDRDCRNLCRLELAEIDVGGVRQKIVSGGQCPKYDAVSAAGEKLPKDAPSPFREREELLGALLAQEAPAGAADASGDVAAGAAGARPPGPRLGLPFVHYLVDTLPFFYTFLVRLGHTVEVLRPGADALAEGDRRCGSPGSCTPVKLLHGLAAADVDVLVAPVFVHLPLPNAGELTYTCPMAQGAPDMVGRALSAAGSPTRVLRPVLFEQQDDGFDSPRTLRTLLTMARALAEAAGASAPDPAAVRAAAAAGLVAQQRFEAGLREIGERALAWARANGRPVVLVAGETHVVHDAVLDAGIHDLVAGNGAVPLPADCYPVPAHVPGLRRVHWASAGQTLRTVAAGIEAGDVFPLLLGAYGCGPNSMVEHLLDDVAGDWPHAVLESDGHGGKAGYVTRVQAFLHSVRGWGADRAGAGAASSTRAAATAAPAPPHRSLRERLERYDRPLPHSLDAGYDRFFFGHIGGGLGKHLAAAMRGAGLDATYVGEADAEALRLAGAACSGKECLPYQLIWGTLARFLRDEAPALNGEKTMFLSAGSGFQACRANLFPLSQQIVLDKLGKQIDVADFSLVTSNLRMMPVVWTALVAIDLLNMLRFYSLAAERERGAADRLFAAYSERLEQMLERPRPDAGLAGNVAGAFRFCAEVEEMLAQASREFLEQPLDTARAAELRDVYLCGDIYLRVDEWGNDDLQRKLADNGLRVIFEPFGEFFELLQLRQLQDGVPLRQRPEKEIVLRVMGYIIDRLLTVVRRDHPWVFWHDVREVDKESRRLTCGYPFGETIPTIGGASVAWRTQPVDGIVSVAPRGCGPALVAEAQLRREPAMPVLFVYNDGDPIDEARLTGFAWRLRSLPARRAGS